MIRIARLGSGRTALGLALLLSQPADAAYKIMKAGEARRVGKPGLVVTPPNDWNRLGARIGRNAESWTLDGRALNDLSFYAGIEPGKPLFREVDKRERPLPKFDAKMLPPDIVQLFEATYRVAAGTALFELGAVEPATLGGHAGVRFAYSFTIEGEEVKRNGEGVGAIVGGKLYLITFEAPAVHYFARDIAAFRKIVASARVN